ncbi:unnamed protein product [Dicrocoelium dendriticum]|nr:unnamed protein product [Dicrocoelium dendriticum]
MRAYCSHKYSKTQRVRMKELNRLLQIYCIADADRRMICVSGSDKLGTGLGIAQRIGDHRGNRNLIVQQSGIVRVSLHELTGMLFGVTLKLNWEMARVCGVIKSKV